YFHYPWSESDDISIDLPPGYQLDHGDTPVPLTAGNISSYNVSIGITRDKKTLVYKRDFVFGNGDTLLFPTTSYEPLRKLFDYVHDSDGHAITLKLAGAAASN
ncbi:MAG: hypothetical protein ACREAC_09590, partial [Blastocatellia bacterium]